MVFRSKGGSGETERSEEQRSCCRLRAWVGMRERNGDVKFYRAALPALTYLFPPFLHFVVTKAWKQVPHRANMNEHRGTYRMLDNSNTSTSMMVALLNIFPSKQVSRMFKNTHS